MAKTETAVMTDTAVKPNQNSKKFIGLRVDGTKANQLQEIANARGISLNELVNGMIDELQQPEKSAIERVDQGITQQQGKAEDLHKNLDRLHALLRLQDHLDHERKDLEGEKPQGIFDELFSSKRLEEWNFKAKALEEKYKRLSQKIEALRDKVIYQGLETETARAGVSDIPEDTTDDSSVTEHRFLLCAVLFACDLSRRGGA
jgi:Skp family chaperone for outer membrane proteins